MASGYDVNPYIKIEFEDVERLNLPSFQILKMMTEKLNFISEYDIYNVLWHGDFNSFEHTEEQLEKYFNLFIAFQDEFKDHTGIGIDIEYHDSEEIGSKYDEVDGLFFVLDFDDVYQFSEKALDLSKKVGFEIRYYVEYG